MSPTTFMAAVMNQCEPLRNAPFWGMGGARRSPRVRRVGAPSFELFGAFFPAWLFCAGVGIGCAIVARVILTRPTLAQIIPHPLWVCSALGVSSGLLFWLVIFR